MGSDEGDSSVREGVADVALHGPTLCPACSYDLRGLPAREWVTCPECGGSFTHAELAAANHPPLGWRVSPLWLTGFCAIVSLWVLSKSPTLVPGGAAVVLWPVVLLWGLVVRREGPYWLVPSLAAAAMMSTVTLLGWGRWVGAPAGAVMVVNGTALTLWAAMWACPPRQSLGGALALLAIAPAPLGAALLKAGVTAFARGHHWTNWDKPFAGPREIQAMNGHEALVLGIELLSIAALLGAIAAMVWARELSHTGPRSSMA